MRRDVSESVHLKRAETNFRLVQLYILDALITVKGLNPGVTYVAMLLVVCQFSRDVIGYKDS